jgi:signal transduction histidine kinase
VTEERPPSSPARPAIAPAPTPIVPAPPPFVERRVASRRAEDRAAHDEAALLARALDILASGSPAEDRLARLLALLARTVGARRAAVLVPGPDRQVAVSVARDEDASAAHELAAWLDAEAPRSRADRAAAGPALVAYSRQAPDGPPGSIGDGLLAVAGAPWPHSGPTDDTGADDLAPESIREPHFASLAIHEAGAVVFGFDFARAEDAADVGERLPPNLARHAAVALALVGQELASERELAELRALDAERTRFVSTVAHELRTPLTGLNGYLELILAGRVEDPDIAREFLERSHGIVASMSDLVGDLLEVSRLEAGTLGLEIRQVSVHEAGSRVIDGLASIALERGVTLRSDLPPRLRAATADRRRVEQILTNLGGNALKFTPDGGTVELAAWFDGPVALLAVRDDGPGVDRADRGRIFERFYRSTGHERVTGTGLGLPIARELARAMGGDLDVASVSGSGSAFILALPGALPVDAAMIAETLDRALAAEEIRLEERAVLRAIHGAGRTGLPLASPLAPPRALPIHRKADADGESSSDESASLGPRSVEPRPAGRTVRFGVIDGSAGRPDAPSLA